MKFNLPTARGLPAEWPPGASTHPAATACPAARAWSGTLPGRRHGPGAQTGTWGSGIRSWGPRVRREQECGSARSNVVPAPPRPAPTPPPRGRLVPLGLLLLPCPLTRWLKLTESQVSTLTRAPPHGACRGKWPARLPQRGSDLCKAVWGLVRGGHVPSDFLGNRELPQPRGGVPLPTPAILLRWRSSRGRAMCTPHLHRVWRPLPVGLSSGSLGDKACISSGGGGGCLPIGTPPGFCPPCPEGGVRPLRPASRLLRLGPCHQGTPASRLGLPFAASLTRSLGWPRPSVVSTGSS